MLATKGLQGRTLTLKLKQDNFRKHERTVTLPSHFGHRTHVQLEGVALARLEEQLRAKEEAKKQADEAAAKEADADARKQAEEAWLGCPSVPGCFFG